eukprot:SAG31_NODE_11729_length_1002_cov_2.264673_2_plen_193_part_00
MCTWCGGWLCPWGGRSLLRSHGGWWLGMVSAMCCVSATVGQEGRGSAGCLSGTRAWLPRCALFSGCGCSSMPKQHDRSSCGRCDVVALCLPLCVRLGWLPPLAYRAGVSWLARSSGIPSGSGLASRLCGVSPVPASCVQLTTVAFQSGRASGFRWLLGAGCGTAYRACASGAVSVPGLLGLGVLYYKSLPHH